MSGGATPLTVIDGIWIVRMHRVLSVMIYAIERSHSQGVVRAGTILEFVLRCCRLWR